MSHHTTPHLLTGSAVLGAALLLAALVATTAMFFWPLRTSTQRILLAVNLIGLTAGLLLIQHNYHHLQATVLIGVALIAIGTVALVMLTYAGWPTHPKAETVMKYKRRRSFIVLYAILTFVSLVSGTILLAVTNFTWHWT